MISIRQLALLLAFLIVSPSGSFAQNEGDLVREVDPRIVGGSNANPHQFPWMVRLSRIGFGFFCGGSLINESWVLTAAHCVNGLSTDDVVLVLGDRIISIDEHTEQSRTAVSFIIHPDFDPETLSNDIALVELSEPALANDAVRSIPIASVPDVGVKLTVIGWGDTSEGGFGSDILQYVDVRVVSFHDCSTAYTEIDDTMFCAGIPEGGVDACQGDSGGPIFTSGENPHLAGIVSFGNGCAQPGFPGVYNRTELFSSWISTTINPVSGQQCLYEGQAPIGNQQCCGGVGLDNWGLCCSGTWRECQRRTLQLDRDDRN